MRDLWGQRNFRLLMAAHGLSMFADTALTLVLGAWAKQLTGSTAAAGTTLLAVALPMLFAPLTGIVIDRFRRRQVMVVTAFGSAGAVLSLEYVSEQADLWLIHVVAFLYGISLIVLQSSRLGLVKCMLNSDQFGMANAFLRTTREGLRIAGPPLGLGLAALMGFHAVVTIVALAFCAAGFILTRLRVNEPTPQRVDHHWLQEATAGIRHLWSDRTMRELGSMAVIVLLVFGCYEVVFFELVDKGLGQPPKFLGVLAGAMGAGSLLGGLSAGWWMRSVGEMRSIAIGFVLSGAGVLLCISSLMPVVLVGCFVAGIGLPLCLIGLDTTIQLRTPIALQGRAGTAIELVTGVPFTTSMALGASLIAFVDYRLMLAAMGGVAILAGFVGAARLGTSLRAEAARAAAAGDAEAGAKAAEPGGPRAGAGELAGAETEPLQHSVAAARSGEQSRMPAQARGSSLS